MSFLYGLTGCTICFGARASDYDAHFRTTRKVLSGWSMMREPSDLF
jgi:hypothetical protein